MPEEKINVATSWESAMIDDFDVQDATPEVETTQETVAEQVTESVQESQATEIILGDTQEETTITPQGTVVERIVEKYPEMSEDSQSILRALQDGKFEDVYKHLDNKLKNFTSMSDYDVIREGLKIEHPEWTEKRLSLEFKTKYDIPAKKDLSEMDADDYDGEYKKAVEFNDAVEEKENLLALQAEEYRIKLEANKTTIEFPKVTENIISNEPTQEQIAEANKQWEAMVVAELPKLSDFKYKLNGEDVIYKITNEEKASLTETMKGFNASDFLTKRGWFDQEGNPNILRITEDVYRLENEGKMIGSVATQIKTATRKEVISKDIKNIDYDDRSSSNVSVSKPFWQVALEAGE